MQASVSECRTLIQSINIGEGEREREREREREEK